MASLELELVAFRRRFLGILRLDRLDSGDEKPGPEGITGHLATPMTTYARPIGFHITGPCHEGFEREVN